jgi:hypothetical protein
MTGRMTDYCEHMEGKRSGESVDLQVIANPRARPRSLALELG